MKQQQKPLLNKCKIMLKLLHGTAGSASTPTSGAGKTSPTKEVPLDPKTVKKGDLVEMLSQHEEQFGKFDMPVEDIASFLLAE